MTNRFRGAIEQGEFAVTCEIIPGRGACEDAQEDILDNARKIYATGLVHALSITDNPGGNPAILADQIGIELNREGICPLVHFTCKDRNRNQAISELYALEREGIENVLFMTGDYEASGWMGCARPVFDLDSVQIQMLASQMNAGLATGGKGGPEGELCEKPTHFFNGCVVNPYKYRLGEVVPQYLKLEKKIICGAQFVITQLGYDVRKMEELKFYLDERGYDIPLIANVFVLTRGTAKLMDKGIIAGCFVSDDLKAKLEAESALADKGVASRIERAAQMVACAKGLGYAGCHIGGFGVDAETVVQILGRADELSASWRECARAVSYGMPDGFYLYELALDANGLPSGLNVGVRSELTEDISGRKLFKHYGLSRFFHYWMLTLGKRFNKPLAASMDRRERKKGEHRSHKIEHVSKTLLYGCMDCGDCGLEACLYSCPMAQCPKSQRNGPCGGSMDGWCEVYPHERYCIWYMAFHRAFKYNELWRLTTFATPPNKWEFFSDSAWSNYTHRRDNAASRLEVSLWYGGAQGGVASGSAASRSGSASGSAASGSNTACGSNTASGVVQGFAASADSDTSAKCP